MPGKDAAVQKQPDQEELDSERTERPQRSSDHVPSGLRWLTTSNSATIVSTLALFLMLASILLPSAKYALELHAPSPAQLLVAICIAVFSGLLFLWILDATSVLRFRSEWVSRSIYGAAIASVLGTSVGVYKDSFSPRRPPFEGNWDLRLQKAHSQTKEATYDLVLAFSDRLGTYSGYSSFKPSSDAAAPVAVQVDELDPEGRLLRLSLYQSDGKQEKVQESLTSGQDGQRFVSSGGSWIVQLSRPR